MKYVSLHCYVYIACKLDSTSSLSLFLFDAFEELFSSIHQTYFLKSTSFTIEFLLTVCDS